MAISVSIPHVERRCESSGTSRVGWAAVSKPSWIALALLAGLLALSLQASVDGHGHEKEMGAASHCVICPALCLSGLAGVLGGIAFVLSRRRGRVRRLEAASRALVWAWTFEHPPRLVV